MPSATFLSGPKGVLDPRLNAYRPDLADRALEGIVAAARYADPLPYQCGISSVPVLERPVGEEGSELLQGEHFMLLDSADGWAWGWCAHDHYVGYVAAAALTKAEGPPPTPVHGDAVETARSFLGLPYVWGGRGGAGIDCSGLVQWAMAARGVSAQRDSDMQQETLGRHLTEDEALQRGDIIFFPGHVGLMADAKTLIHATRYHKKTVVEALDVVVARVMRKNDGVGILARKRVEQ
jgi:cell wall-associated NlpC family hydrolase